MNKKKLIRSSIDAKCYIGEIIVACVGLLLVLLLTVSKLFANQTMALLMWIVYALIFAVVVGYCIYKLVSICREPDRYELYPAEVISSQYAFNILFKGAMCLEIVITGEDGTRIHISTASVFSRSLLNKRYYGRFVGTSVQVLYDRVTGTVLVVDEI